MRNLRDLASGWRAISLIAITYTYFLLFAQFAFIRYLDLLQISQAHLKQMMAAMALGGILSSIAAARFFDTFRPQRRLQAALTVCGLAALFTLAHVGVAAGIGVALLIGAGLGMVTVTLVSHLPLWLGAGKPLLQIGLGTGTGYLICNLPPLFAAPPRIQAVTAAGLVLVGVAVAGNVKSETAKAAAVEQGRAPLNPQQGHRPLSRTAAFPLVLLAFSALVWLDSAAFFIIQNTPSLKAATWVGITHLWLNGLLHLGGALLSAWLLRRRGLYFVLSSAFACLAAACLLLLDPGRAILASLFYPVGVSLYSVALVAYPSLLRNAGQGDEPGLLRSRAYTAGWLYAVAGWIGSALGIGMGQNLGHVPILFVVISGVVILGPQLPALVRQHAREILLPAGVLLLAFYAHLALGTVSPHAASTSAVERGRQVYVSEGCIHCHSQYVRPRTADVLMWGPPETLEELRAQHPPLIGNRRQGPDLSQVGARRSPLWLRAHFFDPSAVSRGSFMPAYASLFTDSTRGDDLVAYMSSLRQPDYKGRLAAEQQWHPLLSPQPDVIKGVALFNTFCATCHLSDGSTRNRWRTSFKRLPPDLQNGPWFHHSAWNTPEDLARVIKFGLPGTDMPGHEYLSQDDLTNLSAIVRGSKPASLVLNSLSPSGDQP